MVIEKDIQNFSTEIKIMTLEMIMERGFGHLGGSFSIIETLAVLFGKQMKIDPKNPDWENRDWFILSKGHAGPAYYSTLALRGYFPKEIIYTLNQNGTSLPSHPDRLKTPGVDCTTGSLGQGLSQAVGIAYGFKFKKMDNRVYCIIGDGECNEGQIWEAFQFASNKRLDNLIIFIDNNKQQVDGYTKNISFDFDFPRIMDSLSFYTQEVDGSSIFEIDQAIDQAKSIKDRPSAIILDTTKAQGLDFYGGTVKSHHLRLTDEDREEFNKEIKLFKKSLEENK